MICEYATTIVSHTVLLEETMERKTSQGWRLHTAAPHPDPRNKGFWVLIWERESEAQE